MKTDGIGVTQNPYNNVQKNQNQGKSKDITVGDILDYQAPVDTYTPTIKSAADPAMIEKLWKDTSYASDAIRKLIASALGIQDAGGQGFWAQKIKNLKLSEAERAEAAAMVSEDGFFGVKKTTERIMSFAKALVGEDASESQIEKMRDAVQKGFDDVAKMFGGFDKLPDVTKETYKSIMAEFDKWLGKDTGAETATE